MSVLTVAHFVKPHCEYWNNIFFNVKEFVI